MKHPTIKTIVASLRKVSDDLSCIPSASIDADDCEDISGICESIRQLTSTNQLVSIVEAVAEALEARSASESLITLAKTVITPPESPTRHFDESMDLVSPSSQSSRRSTRVAVPVARYTGVQEPDVAVQVAKKQRTESNVKITTPHEKRCADALQAVAKMHDSITLERFRTIVQVEAPPDTDFTNSFKPLEEIMTSDLEFLTQALRGLKVRELRDSYFHSAIIVTIAHRRLNVPLNDDIPAARLDKLFGKHPELGSRRTFNRHRAFCCFYSVLMDLANQLGTHSPDGFVEQLLFGLDRGQLDMATWIQDMVLELVFQRIARFSMLDQSIKFDSAIHPLCQGDGPSCEVDVCNGVVWADGQTLCWFHNLADSGVEVRFVSDEKEFGLFATRLIKSGTRFAYIGEESRQTTPYSIQVSKSKTLDASGMHSCAARYINHAPAHKATCKWVNATNNSHPWVEVVRDLHPGVELSVPYSHNFRGFVVESPE